MTRLKRKELHISDSSFSPFHTLAAQPTPFLSYLWCFKRSGSATSVAEDDLHHSFNKAIFCCHGALTWPGCAGGNLCSGHKDIGSGRRRREGRAGLCPRQQRADRLAQAFCEAVVDSWELIHCDWVSWDVTGCCTLSYTFKNWMP